MLSAQERQSKACLLQGQDKPQPDMGPIKSHLSERALGSLITTVLWQNAALDSSAESKRHEPG